MSVRFAGILFIVFLLCFSGTYGYRNARIQRSDAFVVKEPVAIYLASAVSLSELSAELRKQGIHHSESELLWVGQMIGWRRLREGKYDFNVGRYGYKEILEKLGRGIQDPNQVILLPGLTKDAIIELLSGQFRFEAQELASVWHDSSFHAEVGIAAHHLIGRMLPETYSFYWTASPKFVLNRILQEFDKKVIQAHKDRLAVLNRTPDEIATMASIVEWESKVEDEKPRISGLYWNRIRRRMLLQADPTVNFALGERRRLLFEDYKVQHPYNTYLNKGLPPGPITNPSYTSIYAALYPEQHSYLYMVASSDGSHIFTRTFEEHQAESEKWRRWLRQQLRIKRAQEAAQTSGR